MFTGPGAMELLDMPEPDVADGDVLVHVRAAGICGSELHGARHPGFRVPPLIMGHEFAGVSDEGQPVIINPILSCGECDLCARGLRQVCRHRAIVADPGELVPHDQGRHPEAGMAGAVQLAAADPGGAHVHQDVTIGHVRLRHVEQLHRAWTGEHQRVHF